MLGVLLADIAKTRLQSDVTDDLQEHELLAPPAHLTETGRLLIEFGSLLLTFDNDPVGLKDELRSINYPELGLNEYGLIGQMASSDETLRDFIYRLTPTPKPHYLAWARMVWFAKSGSTKENIRQFVTKEVQPDMTEVDFDSFLPYCNSFFYSRDFSHALLLAAEDSTAEVDLVTPIGTIAEAYYGLTEFSERMVRRLVPAIGRSVIRRWKSQFPLTDSTSLRLLYKFIGRLDHPLERRDFTTETVFYTMKLSDVDLSQYADILQSAGLEWTEHSLLTADVKNLNEHVVLALIIGAIRADHFSEGTLKLLVDEGAVERWLERLVELEANKPKKAAEAVRLKLDIETIGSKHSLIVTEDALQIQTSRNQLVDQVMSYQVHDRWLIGRLDDVLLAATRLIASPDWVEASDKDAKTTFQLEVETTEGIWERTGLFDRAHMPQQPWREIVNHLEHFLRFVGYGEIVSLTLFNRALRPGEVKYCGVEFEPGGKLYHYLTYDLEVEVGDVVLVPVGHSNNPREVVVRTIEFCRWDHTPYPLEETKEILRRVEAINPISLEYQPEPNEPKQLELLGDVGFWN